MKLLITGANGQLGNEMRVALQQYPLIEALYTDVDTLDITDLAQLDAFVATESISHIVNCAAYTAVDKAEDDEVVATKVNVDAVRNLGIVANKYGAKIENNRINKRNFNHLFSILLYSTPKIVGHKNTFSPNHITCDVCTTGNAYGCNTKYYG